MGTYLENMSFTPQRSAIANITNTTRCTVVTETDHGLTTGQVVRLNVPKSYGMDELNGKTFSITVFSPTIFNIQTTQVPYPVYVDSTNFTPFVIPESPHGTAEVLPIGSGPTPYIGPEVYVRNGVFITTLDDAVFNNSTSEIPF